jgi:hypothetical protein
MNLQAAIALTDVALCAKCAQVFERGLPSFGEGIDVVEMQYATELRGWASAAELAAESVTVKHLIPKTYTWIASISGFSVR